MAQSVLLVTCILSSLIAAGFSLQCTKCLGMGDTCVGPAVTCPPGDVCTLIYLVTSFGGLGDHSMAIRDCGKPSFCSKQLSYSNLVGKSRSNVNCCTRDECTPPLPVLPPPSNVKNGVKCKSCFETSNKQCESESFVDCFGNETKCMSQVSIVEGVSASMSTALRGCATKEMCEFSKQGMSFGLLNSKSMVSCTDGGHAFHCNWLLLLVSLGLLLKLT